MFLIPIYFMGACVVQSPRVLHTQCVSSTLYSKPFYIYIYLCLYLGLILPSFRHTQDTHKTHSISFSSLLDFDVGEANSVACCTLQNMSLPSKFERTHDDESHTSQGTSTRQHKTTTISHAHTISLTMLLLLYIHPPIPSRTLHSNTHLLSLHIYTHTHTQQPTPLQTIKTINHGL